MTTRELIDRLLAIDPFGRREVILEDAEPCNRADLLGADCVFLWHRVTPSDVDSLYPPDGSKP